MKNTIIKSVLAVVFGIVVGIFSKWGDIIPCDNLIKYFGWISTGVIIWLVIGSFLIIKTQYRKEFSIVYSLFMISMLISYYVFSLLVVKYLVQKIIIFWIIMFIGSLILGNIIYDKKNTNMFRILFILASIIFLIYDAIEINGINLIAIIPEVLMVVYILIITSKSIKEIKI